MRARNIKPGFFKNEELAELGPLPMILFAGLWCMADRDGRLEDRPKRIGAEVLPYFKEVDTNALLDALASRGFIIRYEKVNVRYIAIPERAWQAHQRPHSNEAASKIPAPDEQDVSNQKLESAANQGRNPFLPITQALRSDSLIPDCLIPDSLATRKIEKRTGPDDAELAKSQDEFERLTGAIFNRHPKHRRGGRTAVERQLVDVCGDDAEKLARVDAAHEAWCQEWAKGDQQFVPALIRWLVDGGWRDKPEAEAAEPDMWDIAMKSQREWDAKEAIRREAEEREWLAQQAALRESA